MERRRVICTQLRSDFHRALELQLSDKGGKTIMEDIQRHIYSDHGGRRAGNEMGIRMVAVSQGLVGRKKGRNALKVQARVQDRVPTE